MTFDVGFQPGSRGDVLVCFSHLRWDFVFQRPQHLMTRFARDRKVYYWKNPCRPPRARRPACAFAKAAR